MQTRLHANLDNVFSHFLLQLVYLISLLGD